MFFIIKYFVKGFEDRARSLRDKEEGEFLKSKSFLSLKLPMTSSNGPLSQKKGPLSSPFFNLLT